MDEAGIGKSVAGGAANCASRRSSPDNAKTTGAALEAHYRFILWLVPKVERFPGNRKFLLRDRI